MILKNKLKKVLFRCILVFIFISVPFLLSATHIVGGSLTYVHNGGSSYTITLKLYRDCGPGTAGLPGAVVVNVRGNNGAQFTPTRNVVLNRVSRTLVPSSLDPCAIPPNPLPCVEEGIYRATVNNLPPNPGGYHLDYQIIARNLSIVNINALCNCIGESFYAYIPGSNSVWNEDFALANNTTVDNGATAWNVVNGATSPTSGQVNNNRFEFRGDDNGVATWSSDVINIAANTAGVDLIVDLSENGNFEGTDNISVFYRLNGGAQTLFTNNGFTANDFGNLTATELGLIGTTVQIDIVVNYDGNSPNNERYRIENVAVSGEATPNQSNPEFTLFPPLFLCVNQPFTFDHSATDLDGDSLVYSFYDPYDGDNGNGPLDPTFAGNVAMFTPIVWLPGFSTTNPLGGVPLNLDPATGLLSGIPSLLGQFVLGIKVEEYRNGVYISETLRDFQVNVVNCPLPSPPVAGADIFLNDGCVDTLGASGYIDSTVTWTSIFPGPVGTYDGFLSCTSGCIDPIATGSNLAPAFVDYMICGTASACDNAFICDTVRVTFNPSLSVSISPINPAICFGQTSTTLTATGVGGSPPYSYLWNNINPSQTNVVGAGNFTVQLSDASGCPPVSTTVTVVAFNNPIMANAGADDTVCIQNPIVPLNGSVTGATGGFWSGGNGTFSPDTVTLSGGNYIPTPAEIANGFVDLILTTTGNGNCPLDKDTVRMSFLDFIGNVNIVPTDVSCFGGSNGSATVNITGGIAPFTYFWNTVPAQTSVTATNLAPGIYTVMIQNSKGCITTDSVTIAEPAPIVVNTTANDVSCFGGNTGSVTAAVVGGTGPYNYLWAPGGETTATITAQPVGNYSVTVTDANNCASVANDTILSPPALTVALTQANVTCFGGNDGTANAVVSGGVAPYSYNWNPFGGSSSNAVGLTAGTYVLTITDFNNCVLIDSVVIMEPLTPLTATTSVVDVSCFGLGDGSIAVNTTGGTPGYSYSWSPGGQITDTIENQTVGNYSVTITDTNGCTAVAVATIIEPPSLLVNTNQLNATCNGGDDGTASVSASGGTPGYTYLWMPGNFTTTTISNLTQGVYSVVVTDSNMCQATSSVTITQPALPVFVAVSSTPTLCNGGSDGTVSALASGGTGPYTYLWLPGGQTTAAVNGLVAGTYTVIITDDNGCQETDSVDVTEPSPLSVIINQSDVSCNGRSDGVAITNASGGTGPYTYLWMPGGATTNAITNLIAGSYTVTVTDFNNCTLSDSVVITEPSLVLSGNTSFIRTSCNGGGDGAAIVSAQGGTGPYNYLWDGTAGNQVTDTAIGLSAGTYSVLISDVNGCTSTSTATVEEPAAISIAFGGQNNPSCFGDNNGTVTGGASGGTPNYTYLWMPGGATTNSITNLTAGTYSLTVTDNNGCTDTNSVIITQPTAPVSVSAVSTPVSCNGGSDGSATATGLNGTGPYTYSWLPGGQTGQTISGINAGTYTLTVTDANGCQANNTVSVSEPAPIVLSVLTNNSNCGLADGSASVTVTSGGTAPFTYLWNPTGATTNAISALSAGLYTVTATDDNGCTETASGNVNDNAAPTLSIINVTNVTCNGGSNGTAEVTTAGGTAPFTYLWSPSGETTAIATNLTAGFHSVLVTASNGCQSNISVSPFITEPDPIVTLVTTSSVNCNGGMDGSASAVSIGGSPGYDYQWLPGGTTGSSVTGLLAGIDSVRTTDMNGCTEVTLFTIDEPVAAVSVSFTTTPVSCNGGSDGIVSAIAAGGTAPYSYSWMPGNISGQTISNLPTGTYIVTITDLNGCRLIDSAVVTEPTPINLAISSTNSTCGLPNGQASVLPTGGTGAYAYSWFPSGSTNSVATGLLAGVHTVTVTDINGCEQLANVTVNNTAGPTASVTGSTAVTCNGGIDDGTATVTVTGGTAPFTYLWSPTGGTAPTATGLAAGVYTVVVTDDNNCPSNVAVSPIITEPNPIITLVTTASVTCFGDSDGTASAISVGGTPTYNYLWLPGGSTGPSVAGLSGGIDSVRTTDANGCTQTTLFTIPEPTMLTATVSSTTDVSCLGGGDGSATVTASGGTPFYSYSWSPSGGSGATAVGLTAGNYVVTVTDLNGCSMLVNVTIIEPTQDLSATSTVTNTSCFGGADGVASINPSGGTAPYKYFWSPSGAVNQTEIGLTSGNYIVLVTDTNGCQTNTVVTVNQPPLLVGTLDSISPSCGLDNGVVLATVSGGTAPYSYLWTPNGDTTAITDSLTPGSYSVVITDSLGCQLPLSTNIVDIPGPTISIPTFTDVNCFGGNDGSAVVNIVGGTAPYSSVWSPFGGNTTTGTALTAGSFVVTVTDDLGCIITDSVIISEPTKILISIDSLSFVSCNGGDDGAITISVSGGTGPYMYDWIPNISSDSTANNLVAGAYSISVSDANSCQVSTSINITEPTLPLTSSLSNITDPSCFTSTNGSAMFNVSGGTAPYNYLWSDGQTGSTAVDLIGGTYSVIITDTNGCVTNDTVVLVQPIPVNTIPGTDVVICLGDSIDVTATATGGTGPYSFSWQPVAINNSGTLAVSPTVNTTYNVQAFDQNGCPGDLQDVSAVVLSFDSTNAAANISVPLICVGQSIDVNVQLTDVQMEDSLTFVWNNGLPPSAGPFTVSPTQPTTYTVTVTNSCGVAVTDSVSVQLSPLPTLSISASSDSTCFPGVIQFTDSSTTGNPADQIHTWDWSFGDGSTSQLQDPLHTYDQTGTYQVLLTITTGNGCATTNATTPLFVTVFPKPTASFSINSNTLSLPIDQLETINTSSGASFYNWSFGDGFTSINFEPTYVYETVGEFDIQLIAINQFGCSDTSIAEIVVLTDFIIPNAFTPDLDGASGGFYDPNSLDNNIFFPYISGVEEFEFQIFDRWGELIFRTIDHKQGWDGYYKGELVQKGVYIWKIRALLNDGRLFNKTGDVTLLR